MNKNWLKLFIIGFCLLFVFLPDFCQAIFGGFLNLPYNIAQMQLERLDFIDNTVLRFLFLLFTLAMEGAAFLWISTSFLDWASTLPVQLSNTLVSTGWHFTLGIVNIGLILIFIIIAIAYLLNIETWGMKKALPNLIIIAILINFSLLFVKILVDLGVITQFAIRDAMGLKGLASAAMKPLTNLIGGVAVVLGSFLGGWVLTTALPIPFTGVAKSIALGTGVTVIELATGSITQTIVWIVYTFILGFISLVYGFLFLVRIIAIWLLAIFAPFAFAVYIIPQTSKWFHQWLKALIQWTFLGVILFFLMGLGLSLFDVVENELPQLNFEGGGGILGDILNFLIGGQLDFFVSYGILIVYLIAVLYAAKKLTPMFAEQVWTAGERLVRRGYGAIAPGIRRGGWKAREKMTEKAAEKAAKRAEKAAEIERKVKAGEKITRREKIFSKIYAWRRPPEELEAEVKAMKRQRLIEKRKEVLKGAPEEPEEREAYLRSQLFKEERKKLKDWDKIAAIIEQQAKIGKISPVEEKYVGEAVERGVKPETILERRPDLAPKLNITVKEALSKIDPETLRKRVQLEALNEEVIASMSLRQIREIGEKGKKGLIDQIKKFGQFEPKSPERKKLFDLYKKYPSRSPEKRHTGEILRELKRNPDFRQYGKSKSKSKSK